MESKREQNFNLSELRKKKVLVGTPAYGGMISVPYHNAMISLKDVCARNGIALKSCMIQNESLVTRARNNIVKMFLEDPEKPTHLLFIDADIDFKVEDALSLFQYADDEHQVVCGSYPKKAIDYEMLSWATKMGVPYNELPQYMDRPVLNLKPNKDGSPIRVKFDEPVEVLDTGTGFMLIDRRVFEKMIESYPETHYIPDYSMGNPLFDKTRESGVYALFDTMIADDETITGQKNPGRKRYLSEDYMFCKLWRDIGGKIFVLPWIKLGHFGSFRFMGNIPGHLKLKEAIYKKHQSSTQDESSANDSQIKSSGGFVHPVAQQNKLNTQKSPSVKKKKGKK